VLVIKPSKVTFSNLIKLANEKAESREPIFNSLLDCTEQALLNLYFTNFTVNPEVFHFPFHCLTKPEQIEKKITTGFIQTIGQVVHFVGSPFCLKPWKVSDVTNMHQRCNVVVYRTWQETRRRVEETLSAKQLSMPE